MDPTPLGEYLLELCDRQNLSLREASARAGLAPTTINQIIRRGKSSTPRPDTLRLIADKLGGNYRYMMQLAGYLDRAQQTPLTDIPRLQEFVTRLQTMDQDRQKLIMQTAMMLLEINEATETDSAAVLPGAAKSDASDG